MLILGPRGGSALNSLCTTFCAQTKALVQTRLFAATSSSSLCCWQRMDITYLEVSLCPPVKHIDRWLKGHHKREQKSHLLRGPIAWIIKRYMKEKKKLDYHFILSFSLLSPLSFSLSLFLCPLSFFLSLSLSIPPGFSSSLCIVSLKTSFYVSPSHPHVFPVFLFFFFSEGCL